MEEEVGAEEGGKDGEEEDEGVEGCEPEKVG